MSKISSAILKTNAQGFTLVETLVAISIFVVVIVGPISIAAKSMQSAYYANEQTTAIFLARESLESIRQLRDNSGLEVYHSDDADDNSWKWYEETQGNSIFKAYCKTGNGCDVSRSANADPQIYISCQTGGCPLKQYKKPDNNSHPGFLYGYGTGNNWENSPFKRKILVEDKGDAVAVTVTVSWDSILFGGAGRSVVLQSWIYDQYRRYED